MHLVTPLTTLRCVALCIFVIGDRKDSKFDVQIKCAIHSLQMTNHP